MRRNQSRQQKPRLFYPGNRPRPMVLAAPLHFTVHLGKMEWNRHPGMILRPTGDPSHDVEIGRVGSMGRDRWDDPIMPGEFRHKVLDERDALIDGLVIWRVEGGERLADDATQTGPIQDAPDLRSEEHTSELQSRQYL